MGSIQKNIYGTNAPDTVTYTKVVVAAGQKVNGSHFESLKSIINQECARRTLLGATFTAPVGSRIEAADLADIVNAIKRFDASASVNTIIDDALFNAYSTKVYNAGLVCLCNCNYCTCNCNYCTCNCNYCTCNCNYCTCNYQCP